MKRKVKILFMASLTFAMLSCHDIDVNLQAPENFSISASVQNFSSGFIQTIFNGGNDNSTNVFNRTNQSLYLQSYKNGINEDNGYWILRINGVDIENIDTPYTLSGAEGSITWIDESISTLQTQCVAEDILCFYSGIGVDEIDITIIEVSNGIIEGEFSGRLYHTQVNPSVVRDPQDYVDVENGEYKMQFIILEE